MNTNRQVFNNYFFTTSKTLHPSALKFFHRLPEILASTCEKWGSKLKDFKGEPDHVHKRH